MIRSHFQTQLWTIAYFFTPSAVYILTIFEKQMHWYIPVNYYLHQGTRKFNVLGSCYIIPPMKNQNNEPDQPINKITFNNNCKKINMMQFFFFLITRRVLLSIQETAGPLLNFSLEHVMRWSQELMIILPDCFWLSFLVNFCANST